MSEVPIRFRICVELINVLKVVLTIATTDDVEFVAFRKNSWLIGISMFTYELM